MARLVLLGQKGASQRRLDPERPEVTGRNDLRDDALGFSASRDVRVGARESCYALEGGGRPAEMLELRIGPPELAGASCRARASQIQHRETVGLGKGERTEQGRVDQAVDGRHGADPERERQQHDGDQARTPGETPRGMTEVEDQDVQHDIRSRGKDGVLRRAVNPEVPVPR